MGKEYYGVHYLCIRKNLILYQQIMALENGKFRNTFTLEDELPFVKWLGGMAILSGIETVELNFPCPLIDLQSYLLEKEGNFVWHISPEEYSSGLIYNICRL